MNPKRNKRIMRENRFHAKPHRNFKTTTYSDHDLPVKENMLNRDFAAAPSPLSKRWSATSPTFLINNGWQYLLGIMDLCGCKMVGVAIGKQITKQLVMDTPQDAIRSMHLGLRS